MTSPTAKELRERYGKPPSADCGAALRALGLREYIHPADAKAFLYPSREAADAFAAGNLRHHGHPDLGSYETPEGIVGLTDLRPALAEAAGVTADPRLPDDAPKPYGSGHIPGARPPRY